MISLCEFANIFFLFRHNMRPGYTVMDNGIAAFQWCFLVHTPAYPTTALNTLTYCTRTVLVLRTSVGAQMPLDRLLADRAALVGRRARRRQPRLARRAEHVPTWHEDGVLFEKARRVKRPAGHTRGLSRRSAGSFDATMQIGQLRSSSSAVTRRWWMRCSTPCTRVEGPAKVSVVSTAPGSKGPAKARGQGPGVE